MQSMQTGMIVMDTSIRIKDETYKTIVKSRGAFEQTFGTKLTLDETVFLSTSYVNIVYDVFQSLLKEGHIVIGLDKDGSPCVKSMNLGIIAQKALPPILLAFVNYQKMLKQKTKEPLQCIVGT